MSENNTSGSWFRNKVDAGHILQAIVVLVGLGAWLLTGSINSANTKEALDAAMITVNARLDRIFLKLDTYASDMPVVQEKLRAVIAQLDEAKGANGSLEVRLRAIESNNAANHADIKVTNPKLYPTR